MNKVFLIGNLTRDPELTETSSGVAICRFPLAVRRGYRTADNEPTTDFFNCVTWRGQAESVARYAQKGNKLAVCGSIKIRDYETNSGEKRKEVTVQVQDVEFLTPKKREEDTNESNSPAQQSAPSKPKPALQSFDDDEDIPF